MEAEPVPPAALELWGGVECTRNRVGANYFDQLEYSGHDRRPEDLDRFAELGIAALRYPLLWERIQPGAAQDADWAWAAERLGRLQALGIRPIVGLVHHGSGPPHTSLLDPHFPDLLAAFARELSRRHPWVEDYTPVNEPLTTARFSGLYGHWYPHGRDGLTFARALLTECRATVLAMQAVRRENTAARLVQTDDVGKTFSTPALKYQADFENERRWLAFDLLCGRVDHCHPLWGYLTWVGIGEGELAWFLEHPCPPDVVGVNYYVTSERFLDERLERYPPGCHGGNGRHRYADTEAVRARAEGIAGPAEVLGEAWERYRKPLAITEAHLGCTREEQMRWLLEMWDAALACRHAGADVRAVTAWSLLGSFDWDSLVTRRADRYETGVFDLRCPRPRPTALAGMLRQLAAGRRPRHPVLASPGWWRRHDRLPNLAAQAPRRTAGEGMGRPLLITGAGGTLGPAFARICRERGLAHRLLSRQEMDSADPSAVATALRAHDPWAVVNADGYGGVDEAESDAARCQRENTEAPAVLAAACRSRRLRLLTFSSDLVFGGRRSSPYLESDVVSPLNVYGRSKAGAEERVLRLLPATLVVRTGALFGPWDEHDYVARVLRTLAAGRRLPAAEDVTVSATYVPDLVHACLDLLLDGEEGVWHLANPGAVSWAELARQVARLTLQDEQKIEGCSLSSLALAAPRPVYSVLGSERGTLLPPLDDALARCLAGRHRTLAPGATATRPAPPPVLAGCQAFQEELPCPLG